MTTLLAVSEWGPFDAVLLELIDRPAVGASVKIAALAIAAGIGAVHALGPGHGKALIGAYLAGTRGRARDALALGGVVATMHTGSVLVLGYALYLTQRTPLGERLGPALALVSAVAVAAVGVSMLWRQRTTPRGRDPALARTAHGHAPAGTATHDHAPGDTAHAPGDTAHDHDGHHHAPLPDGVAPLSRSGLVALATTGGLLPSPSAFLVLATALAIGQAGYGLALVAAFSVGLAATLAAIGLAVLAGRSALVGRTQHRPGFARLARALGPLSAAGVLLGAVIIGGAAILRLL